MSSISFPATIITRARDLFILYSKKAAFALEEYGDVHAVYKRLTEAVEASTESGSAELSEQDIKYIVSAMNVCATRTPVEVQNYKPIGELLDVLGEALKPVDADAAEEKSSVTEL
jgi:hypothetical protein